MKYKLIKVPKWFRILRRGTTLKQGDMFLNQTGQWITTSDYGRKVCKTYPTNFSYPKWTGIYIRHKGIK